MNQLWGESGNSLIESVFALQVLFVVFFMILSLSYFVYVKVSLQVGLHEAVVCTIRENNSYLCKKWLKNRLSKVIFFGQIKSIKLRSYANQTRGRIEWKLKNSKLKIKHSYQLRNTLIKPTRRALF